MKYEIIDEDGDVCEVVAHSHRGAMTSYLADLRQQDKICSVYDVLDESEFSKTFLIEHETVATRRAWISNEILPPSILVRNNQLQK